MNVETKSLIYFVTDALAQYSEDFQILKRDNPILVRLNGTRYAVHISFIHDSGENRDNDDEERIQLSRPTVEGLRAQAEQGIATAFIGFFSDGTVFSAWEPDHIFSLEFRDMGSVYARFSHLLETVNYGAALRSFNARYLRRNTSVVTLRSDALGFYLENLATMHLWQGDAELRAIINQGARLLESDQKQGTQELETEIAGERTLVTITRTAFRRDPKFREVVLRAYDGRCCVCGRQLGLVEAAHIIPHGNEGSNDHVTNGLALCVEHHRLYDSVLLIPQPDQKLFLNPDRVEHLRNIGQDAGLDAIEALAALPYRIPDHVPHRPNRDFLERGKHIRLGTGA
jgi:putative restriction endonuclease